MHTHEDLHRTEHVEFPAVDIRAVWEDFFKSLKDEKLIATAPSAHQIERIAVRYECLINPVWPAPGVEQMLWRLHRGRFTMGLISNGQFFTPHLFERFFEQPMPEYGIREDACVWSYKRHEAKPSARLFERSAKWFAENISLRPEQILYVGNDFNTDILPAHKVGFRTALYAGDQRCCSLDEHSAIQPNIIFTEWSQLLKCVIREESSC